VSARLVGIAIGLIVAAFYAFQLQRLRSGRMTGRGQSPAAARIVAIAGLVIGLGVAAWWLLS